MLSMFYRWGHPVQGHVVMQSELSIGLKGSMKDVESESIVPLVLNTPQGILIHTYAYTHSQSFLSVVSVLHSAVV